MVFNWIFNKLDQINLQFQISRRLKIHPRALHLITCEYFETIYSSFWWYSCPNKGIRIIKVEIDEDKSQPIKSTIIHYLEIDPTKIICL